LVAEKIGYLYEDVINNYLINVKRNIKLLSNAIKINLCDKIMINSSYSSENDIIQEIEVKNNESSSSQEFGLGLFD